MKALFEELDAFSIFFGAFVTALIAWAIHRWDLRTKKKVMNEELTDKMEVVLRLEKETHILYSKFEQRDIKEYQGDAFEDLHLDIYHSMSKDDLYKIYKRDLIDLVKVYKQIEFLNKMSPHNVYADYVDRWEAHRLTSEHIDHAKATGGDAFCDFNLTQVERAKKQLRNNLETIRLLKGQINKVANKSFYWLNPLNNV